MLDNKFVICFISQQSYQIFYLWLNILFVHLHEKTFFYSSIPSK